MTDPRDRQTGIATSAPPGRLDAGADRPALVDAFPSLEVIRAWFREITVPAGAPIASGHSAWYVLRSIYVPRDRRPFGLVGADIHMLPTDPNAAATVPSGATAAVWGDVLGLKAAIVVTRNLGMPLQTWHSAPAFVPGVQDTAGQRVSPANTLDYLIVQSFPSGKINDVAPSKLIPLRRSLPVIERFNPGDTLDVALVLDRNQANDAADGTAIVGYAMIDCLIMPTEHLRAWRG